MVSIDTEVDKGADWRISNPATFRGVTHVVPNLLTPLFERYDVKPTYLLSPEVIESDACAAVFLALGDLAELGTHLHADLIDPHRSLPPDSMAGSFASSLQMHLPPSIEQAKLHSLTKAFANRFGFSPRAFRAGRFAIGPHSLEALAGLGYIVDSSVTPGIKWRYEEGTVDFSDRPRTPVVVNTSTGRIVEIPVTIWSGRAARFLDGWPRPISGVARRVAPRAAGFHWLRPSWTEGKALIRLLEQNDDEVLVLMFHNIELVAGASPYASTDEEVRRILSSLEQVIRYCAAQGCRFPGLSEIATELL